MIPKDPMILLSYLNMQLRDYFTSLDEFCAAMNQDKKVILEQMASIDYHYDQALNRFV